MYNPKWIIFSTRFQSVCWRQRAKNKCSEDICMMCGQYLLGPLSLLADYSKCEVCICGWNHFPLFLPTNIFSTVNEKYDSWYCPPNFIVSLPLLFNAPSETTWERPSSVPGTPKSSIRHKNSLPAGTTILSHCVTSTSTSHFGSLGLWILLKFHDSTKRQLMHTKHIHTNTSCD